MRTVTLEEAQSHLAEIIETLTPARKSFDPRQQAVARLVGERKHPARSRPGKNMITIVSDDDEHLKDFAEYMP